MIPTIYQIGITVSYDMGWQKRATGKVYDSLSGHGYFIGCNTDLVVRMGVKKKYCSISSDSGDDGALILPKKCNINHTGSSEAMEAALVLDLIAEIFDAFDGHLFIDGIIINDNSTMRFHCKNLSNGGKLSENIPQPSFLADPQHRVKVIMKLFLPSLQLQKIQNGVKRLTVFD